MLKFYFDRILFSTYVKVWRNLHDLSMKEMCELAGLSYNTLNGIEHNDAMPHMDSLLAICSAMDVDPKQFFKTSQKGS